ncbi:hypothetical protein COLO4_29870 [Corchorus olitorius]|uniref:Prolamin-like domain-containing protein n=1 Tax=Corchorus olitorius TaxID=93759 RepID=A0A1R3HCT1_9ROSI|nr:hypothetical protein COLO4_29870 [Corchorus olitorius]
MANIALKFLTVVVVALAMMASSVSLARRPLVSMESPNKQSQLIGRLKLDEESPSCWEALMQLQACAGEVILFFLNGETYLGEACCESIHTIGQQCWPNMLETLGYTTEEGDILQGYCDHEIANSPPSHLNLNVPAGTHN